jgi:tyrosyl-tRNA synthetase
MEKLASDPAAAAAYLERNTVDSLPKGALATRIAEGAVAGRPLRVKLGIDPTAPDIHLGHVVVLQKLREFQDAGHLVVLIIGDFTARIGDPSGRSVERPVLTVDEIEANARTFQEQAFKVLNPERVEVRRNSEWLDMGMEQLFGLLRRVTMARVIERDDFQQRIAEAKPISMLELLYPVMQGYDSIAVEADVEIGGTDQKFNLLLGRDVQVAFDLTPQVILTAPILPGTDGERRMSKSLDNYIGLSEPPEEMFGKLMRVPDSAMDTYYELLIGEPRDRTLLAVEAKRALGRGLVERFYGASAAAVAERHFDRLHKEHGLPDEIEEVSISADDSDGGKVHLPALIAKHFGVSRGEARRLLAQGGVKLDGEPLDGAELDIDVGRLDGRALQVGKRRFRRLRLDLP